MTTTRDTGNVHTGDRAGAGEAARTGRLERDDSGERSDTGYPRIVEEHAFVDADGQDNVEATDDRGRRWYHLRLEPRSRADVMGFNSAWWAVALIVAIVILFVPRW